MQCCQPHLKSLLLRTRALLGLRGRGLHRVDTPILLLLLLRAWPPHPHELPAALPGDGASARALAKLVVALRMPEAEFLAQDEKEEGETKETHREL